ncbi:MAG: carbamoyl-phosphate synthase domain-containing protein, partial [Schleiferiaceae bacterium]|nr:carbamoyl-phosphate synthase domain-containing protein [Schleiferiaceae bacterium]
MKKQARILLQDGTRFAGYATGMDGTASGEVCFNTGMTGYQEIFTDPSYKGQIMVTAASHIGNYGVTLNESEHDKVQIAGLICRSFSDTASRARSDQDLASFLADNQTVAVSDVDTRALVRHLREKGSMNGVIST